MTSRTLKWTIHDLSCAMANAISQCADDRYLRQSGSTLKFNGFWRQGDKQNVCAWLDKATWHDAKTGEGGGCREFAQMAFNMTLPEFMERYSGRVLVQPNLSAVDSVPKIACAPALPVDEIWRKLCARDQARYDHASYWLEARRGFVSPRKTIGSGFANLYEDDLELFDKSHQALIAQRLSLGPNIVVPIRGTQSDKVENLFFRAMGDVAKDQKSRLLTGAGGFGDLEHDLRAFGFPHLIAEFSNLLLCEGMADYFALECLLHSEKNYLPLGVASASALSKWAEWLVRSKYRGCVIVVYQLDADQNGQILSSAIGQKSATSALKILRTGGVSANLFKWSSFLKAIPDLQKIPEDFAEIYAIARNRHDWLSHIFLQLH